MNRARVWIVEMFDDGDWGRIAKWMPTVGVALTRQEARAERDKWKERNPSSHFRVRQYSQLSRE